MRISVLAGSALVCRGGGLGWRWVVWFCFLLQAVGQRGGVFMCSRLLVVVAAVMGFGRWELHLVRELLRLLGVLELLVVGHSIIEL